MLNSTGTKAAMICLLAKFFELQLLVCGQCVHFRTTMWQLRQSNWLLLQFLFNWLFSDGNIYIFTASSDRVADADVLESYEANLAAKVKKDAELKAQQNKNTVTIKVSLDDGAPTTEFQYEKGTDPAAAAAKFIQDYNLPFSYLDEITEYIKMNVPEAREYGVNKSNGFAPAGKYF